MWRSGSVEPLQGFGREFDSLHAYFMAKTKKNNDIVCPECLGKKEIEFQIADKKWVDTCSFCQGIGYAVDQDIEEKLYSKEDWR